MRIAIDAMGGDHAPAEIVKGAAHAATAYGVDVILVGDEQAILKTMPRSADSSRLEIKHCTECIQMCDPAASFRTKKDASLVLCAEMVRDGKAQAMISAGNTAAAMAVATFKLGRIEGVERPAIGAELPSLSGRTIMIDAGANADCEVDHLLQFAVMGSIYAEKVMGIRRPRVGLLSIGEEECKGNELTKLAHQALRRSGLNFIGNIEGSHLFTGSADVIVCDGFAGNVALKTAEGIGDYVNGAVKQLAKRPKTLIPVLLAAPVLKLIRRGTDYSEYGGAPLLGTNGICIIGHGKSNAKAISNAVRAAVRAVDQDIISTISDSLCRSASHSVKVV